MFDSNALWSSVSGLLQSAKPSSASKHAADDFAYHFREEIGDIRDATSNASAAVLEHRSVSSLFAFRPVTADEITNIVM